MEVKIDFNELQKTIGYEFVSKKLLIHAMTHSSFAGEHKMKKEKSNERLEFLGDAVLELCSSEFLYKNYKDMPEGELTKLRASAVCEFSLAGCARSINLGRYIILGRGEYMTGGMERDSILSDAFEALIGAIYLDGGFASAKEFVFKFVMNDLENKQLFYDSKTILQEMIQKEHTGELSYKLIDEKGPDHCREFIAAVYIDDRMYAIGNGTSKKSAEQAAAYKAILTLKTHKCSND